MILFFTIKREPPTRKVFWLLILTSLISFSLNSPWLLYRAKEGNLFKDNGWEASYLKAKDITSNLAQFNPTSNASKREFRLTLPLLIKLLGFPPPWQLYLVQLNLGIFLFLVFYFLIKNFLSWDVSLLLTLSLPFLYFGRSAWVDLSGWFDTCAYFLIVLGLWTRVQPLKILLFLLAFWTDERALLCFPIVLIWENRDYILKSDWLKVINVNTLFLCVGPILYFLGRIYLQHFYGLSTPTWDLGLENMKKTLANFSLAQISFFEGYWILFGLFLKEIWLTKRWGLLFLFLFLLINQSLVAFSVLDTTRSGSYWFPLILPALYFYKNLKGTHHSLLPMAKQIAATTLLIPGFFTLNGIQYLIGLHEELMMFIVNKLIVL